MNSSFDFSDGLFAYLWWMIPVAAAAFLAQTRWLKNFAARFAVNVRAKCELDAGVYHAFPKLDVRLGGRHEQIDCVYVSRFGIFVVSTPNQQGRIWGDDGKGMWTQEFHKSQAQFMTLWFKTSVISRYWPSSCRFRKKCFTRWWCFPKTAVSKP